MYLLHNAQLLHDGEESMFRPIMLVFKLLSFSCLTHTLFKKVYVNTISSTLRMLSGAKTTENC